MRRDFIMNAFNLTEDQAITAITVAMDFGVDQVSTLSPSIHCLFRWLKKNTHSEGRGAARSLAKLLLQLFSHPCAPIPTNPKP
jgi:hypothetical protein